jgi:hypothetical protein
MKLNHVNIAVPDVAATRAFFENLFGLKCTETKGADTLSVLTDGEGFVLILSNFEKQVTPQYPRDFHLGSSSVKALIRLMSFTKESKPSVLKRLPRRNFTAVGAFTSSHQVA